MRERQADNSVSRSRILRLAPQKVGRLVASQIAVQRICALILQNLEGIFIDIFNGSVWVIAEDIDVRLVILPIYVVFRSPFVGILIEGEPDIVSPVAVVLQCPGFAAVVVHDIDSDLILVGESGVVRPGLVDLRDFAGDGDQPWFFIIGFWSEIVFLKAACGQPEHGRQCHCIVICPFHEYSFNIFTKVGLASRSVLILSFADSLVSSRGFRKSFHTISLFHRSAVVYVICPPRLDANVDALAGAVDHNRARVPPA